MARPRLLCCKLLAFIIQCISDGILYIIRPSGDMEGLIYLNLGQGIIAVYSHCFFKFSGYLRVVTGKELWSWLLL